MEIEIVARRDHRSVALLASRGEKRTTRMAPDLAGRPGCRVGGRSGNTAPLALLDDCAQASHKWGTTLQLATRRGRGFAGGTYGPCYSR